MSLPAPHPDSIALITGASAGIGEQFARQLASRGHRLAIVARRADRLARLVEDLGGSGRVTALSADLAVAEDRDRLVAEIEELGVQVEILVNNAGVGTFGSFIETGRDAELRQVRLDVEAVVDLMARYLPAMVQRRRGAIINMASASGFQPLPYNAGYAAAKSHVLLLSEAVSAEVREHGVTVTAVCPGPVPTEFQEANDAQFVERLPKMAWVSAERVVEDALAAADRGKRTVIPGPTHVRASFAPNRFAPSWLALPIAKRVMRR